MNPKKIRVAVVEDNAALREQIGAMLMPPCTCVGSYPNAEAAIGALPAINPDIVLMDIQLPGMSGIDCVRVLSGKLPATQIIMITVYDDSDSVYESLAAGASGYLLKPLESAGLADAIQEVLAGGAPMSMSIARRVIQTFRRPATEPDAGKALGARELEILEMLAKGFLKKEIADKLGISYWTIQTHVGRIYKKLHVHSRAQAVAKFRQL
ncbi:MAG: response regulator transcription factor [Verrucomicrobiota bacterium]